MEHCSSSSPTPAARLPSFASPALALLADRRRAACIASSTARRGMTRAALPGPRSPPLATDACTSRFFPPPLRFSQEQEKHRFRVHLGSLWRYRCVCGDCQNVVGRIGDPTCCDAGAHRLLARCSRRIPASTRVVLAASVVVGSWVTKSGTSAAVKVTRHLGTPTCVKGASAACIARCPPHPMPSVAPIPPLVVLTFNVTLRVPAPTISPFCGPP